jgi:hypothetical protein
VAKTYGPQFDAQQTAAIQAAAAAEGLSEDAAFALMYELGPRTIDGMRTWLRQDADAQGATELEWRRSWPALAGKPDPDTRVVMRSIADFVDGRFEP